MKAIPTAIVIFGATGDLFRKKLAPALLDLFTKGLLPDVFRVVAFSRRQWSDDEFRKFLAETLKEKSAALPPDILQKFLAQVVYAEGNLDNLASYEKVANLLGRLDTEAGVCMNKLFYLATPPASYEGILGNISRSGLAIPCAPTKDGSKVGWTRILIEKPFGSDLAEAQRLDRLLAKLFSENQIFRIDHYLAKDALQNILSFRFKEKVLEPLWNAKHIEKVEVHILEKAGVEGRGAFYDALGALRDVGQNHALQMAALVAMEEPKEFTVEAIRGARAAVLKKFVLWDEDWAKSAVRGQYEGYLAEAGVPSSETETYFKLKLSVDNERWRGVQFILEGGKGLVESRTDIVVHFKKEHTFICPVGVECGPDNTVIFNAQSKKTGGSGLDAYEKVLADAIRGDQTVFTSTAEVEAEWKVIMSVLQSWKRVPLVEYKKGSIPEVGL